MVWPSCTPQHPLTHPHLTLLYLNLYHYFIVYYTSWGSCSFCPIFFSAANSLEGAQVSNFTIICCYWSLSEVQALLPHIMYSYASIVFLLTPWDCFGLLTACLGKHLGLWAPTHTCPPTDRSTGFPYSQDSLDLYWRVHYNIREALMAAEARVIAMVNHMPPSPLRCFLTFWYVLWSM